MSSAADPESTTMPLPKELTLIVAATNKMGIGRAGQLPWTGLKKEMAYFARVTKRAEDGAQNNVIMGRKTWDSIPQRFRPLKDRTNIVISRSSPSPSPSDDTDSKKRILVSSISEAISYTSTQNTASRTFVIGGAQIYKAALERKETKRILLTRVLEEFECDVFFPVRLGEDGMGEDGWKRRGKEELDRWVGESVVVGEQEEGGTKYVFEMWERDD